MQVEKKLKDPTFWEIEKLRQEVENLQREKADLEILLETTTIHADSVESLLHEANKQLQAEIIERRRTEVALKAAQAELQSLLAMVTRDKTDLEILLQMTTEHGDMVENFLYDQCIRDPLTNLFNRRYLENSLEREIYCAQRLAQPLGIVTIDIDYFKHYNDTFGHEAGDVVLRELSLFLQQNIRPSDIACRYGGEEFVLILPKTSLQDVQQIAEHLRQGVKSLHLEHLHHPLDGITISLGIACFPEHGQTIPDLLQAADMALYRAKALGRDRLCVSA